PGAALLDTEPRSDVCIIFTPKSPVENRTRWLAGYPSALAQETRGGWKALGRYSRHRTYQPPPRLIQLRRKRRERHFRECRPPRESLRRSRVPQRRCREGTASAPR